MPCVNQIGFRSGNINPFLYFPELSMICFSSYALFESHRISFRKYKSIFIFPRTLLQFSYHDFLFIFHQLSHRLFFYTVFWKMDELTKLIHVIVDDLEERALLPHDLLKDDKPEGWLVFVVFAVDPLITSNSLIFVIGCILPLKSMFRMLVTKASFLKRPLLN